MQMSKFKKAAFARSGFRNILADAVKKNMDWETAFKLAELFDKQLNNLLQNRKFITNLASEDDCDGNVCLMHYININSKYYLNDLKRNTNTPFVSKFLKSKNNKEKSSKYILSSIKSFKFKNWLDIDFFKFVKALKH